MKELLKKAVLLINIFSFLLTLLWGVLGVVCEIIGIGRFERILLAVNDVLEFERFCLIGYILLIVLIITSILHNKLKKST